ncbi:MAG: hypothetical protein EAX87_00035 [Candidatus Thorarchaeota archaeon]|nr:hypothetical protein [Candidatus Thorarchaeota archaeon]
MAIDEGKGFTQPRTGPKSFTEYSFGALLVFVGLLGSMLATFGSVSVYVMFWGLASLLPGFSSLYGSVVIAVLMIPFGIAQGYYAWKLHTQDFRAFQTVNIICVLIIALSIVSAILSGFFALLTLQITVGQVVLNAIVIFFLLRPEVQAEFTWSTVQY